jgi:ribose transport system permease protein
MTIRSAILLRVLDHAPLGLFAAVFAAFGLLAPSFLEGQTLTTILVHASSTAIVAVGMTFVLLTAGVDLSVGAIMFVAAAVAGKLAIAGAPLPLAIAAVLGVGLAFGAVNALLVTRLGILPFIVTLSTLFVGRGFALWLTETRAMNLPESLLQVGAARALGVPLPVWILAAVLAVAHGVLSRTPFGRQVYAVGHSLEGARKAGVATGPVLAAVYVISGLCAALGGLVSLSLLGSVSPTFGEGKEFAAIAAAVLGGTSLFGGRGRVLPGTLVGAALIQTIESGLVSLNADPYLYPLVTSGVIFAAVLLDRLRQGAQARWGRRRIRMETGGDSAS